MRILFRIYGYLQRMGQSLMMPVEWIGSLTLRLRRLLSRGVPRVRVSQWRWVRRLKRAAYWLAASPNRILAKSAAQAESEDRASSATRRLLGLLFRASLLEPVRWLTSMAGLAFRWVISRPWPKIFLRSVPSCLLLILMFFVWQGGRLNKLQLAQWYLDMGESELANWESKLDLSGSGNLLVSDSAMMPSASKSLEAGDAPPNRLGPEVSQVSTYGEMLFRRIHLLQPSDQSRFVIGLTHLQHGSEQEALKWLRQLAPEDDRNDPRAHGIMAAIYLKQISETIDESYLPLFLHHATAGAAWSKTPPEVLIAAAEILWRTEREEQAIDLLQIAANNHPELFLLVYERSQEARLPSLAESARKKGIDRFERILQQNPQDDFSRIQLALLENTKSNGLDRAVQVLKQGQGSEHNPMIARALSEVYLKHFVQKNRAGTPHSLTLDYLDRAMASDSSNPNVADQIAIAINASPDDKRHLINELNRILVSGRATTGTHALFAEYYLSQNQESQALLHLEQVFRVAPTAAKYANHLVLLYESAGRLDDAFKVANRSLTWLERREILGEKYVDDLLENLGRLYEFKNDEDEAIPVYELALTINPERSEIRHRLAKIYRAKGRESDAVEQEFLAAATEKTIHRQQAFLSALEDPSSSVLTKLRTSFENNNSRKN